MNILETIVSEVVGFLGVTQAWDIVKAINTVKQDLLLKLGLGLGFALP